MLRTLANWGLAALLLFPTTAAAQDLPRGHFYTQTGGDSPRPDDGFLVADRPGFGFTSGRNFVRFSSEFDRHGGVAILGYPASRPFVWDGFEVQVFQKSILQWRPDVGSRGEAWSMNVFDEFTRRGLDQRLLIEKQVPLPARYDDSGKTFEQIMAQRLELLNGHPALARQFWSVLDPLMLYGLPNSRVQDFGPFYAVRLQRAVFQEWKIDAPGIARVGDVTVVNAGDAAKEYGLIREPARQPVAPPPPASPQIALFTPGLRASVDAPFGVAGDTRAFEATVVWELSDPQRGAVLGRGFTTAAACCEWSSFEFQVPYSVASPRVAQLAVWGASGRDENERPGEVRVPLELTANERPPAAKDGVLLIEPLRSDPGAGSVRVRVRNESGSPVSVAAPEFGLRDESSGATTWSQDATRWTLPPGAASELLLRIDPPPGAADARRLLHRSSSSDTRPVVIDL